MSQHDYNVANGDGATVRADMNSLFQAIAENNAGATAPGTTFANMWWMDTANNLLKQRNATNTDWVTVAEKDGDAWAPRGDGSALTGLTADQVAYDPPTDSVLTATDLQGAIDELEGLAVPTLYHYQEQRASGTTGPTYSGGAYRTAALNKGIGVDDPVSDQIVLPAGTYEITRAYVAVTAGGTLSAKLRLRDITNTETLAVGANAAQGAGTPDTPALDLAGTFTLAAQATIELQVWPSANTTAPAALTSGEVEVYSELCLRRTA